MSRIRVAAAFVLFFCLFAWRASETRTGSGYLDPDGKIQAQDEAVYSHAAIRMAERGEWSTPYFLDRFFLYKPPLVYWLSGASAKLLGVSAWALRLPSMLVAALVCALVFHRAGLGAAALAASSPVFFTLARRNMTDALLTGCIAGVAWMLWRDARIERRSTAAGLALFLAAAALTKSVAAGAPAAIFLAVCLWERAPVRRIALVSTAALALAAPWFVWQFRNHPRWFRAEFVDIELLAWGRGDAPQQSGDASDAGLAFYARRLWSFDPLLCLAAVAGLRRRPDSVTLAWTAIMTAALAGYNYRNATYLMPLVPALALFAAPPRTRASAVIGLLLLAWRVPPLVTPQDTLTGAALIEQRCDMGRANPLIIVNAEDQFHGTVLPMPVVRYAIPGTGQPPKGFALDFRSMGIVVGVDEYAALDAARARYASELAAWGLPDNHALATVIAWPEPRDLERLITSAADADFVVPTGLAAHAAKAPHERRSDGAGNLLLLSRVEPGRAPPRRACRM